METTQIREILAGGENQEVEFTESFHSSHSKKENKSGNPHSHHNKPGKALCDNKRAGNPAGHGH
jgi:hypothetical protein